MPNPLHLLGDSQPLPAPPLRPMDQKAVSGVVSRIVGDDIYVSVREFSGTYDFGPVEVPAGWGPGLNDRCLLNFDQNNVAYVVWHS
jgi:hypothetical protein